MVFFELYRKIGISRKLWTYCILWYMYACIWVGMCEIHMNYGCVVSQVKLWSISWLCIKEDDMEIRFLELELPKEEMNVVTVKL